MTAKQKEIRTVREALTALGGPTAVARALFLDQSTVSGWIMHGEISGRHNLTIYLTLKHRRHKVSPRVFGADDWSNFVLPRAALRSHKPPALRKVA